MSFTLQSVVSSKTLYAPQRFLLYGVQGIGKTLCASTFASPIILRTEDGTSAIDVPTFPDLARTYEDVTQAISALHGEHPYRTLVIDSLDWMEPLIWDHVCQKHVDSHGKPIASIEAIGYGKGYIEADAYWRYIQSGLDSLRLKKGMQIVCIAHAEVKTFCPPDGDQYDRYQPKLQKRAFALWQEWADEVFFVNYRRRMIDNGQNSRSKRAEGDGARVIFTSERPAYLAKNRWSMPDEIYVGQDRTWKPLHDTLRQCLGEKYPYPFTDKQEA